MFIVNFIAGTFFIGLGATMLLAPPPGKTLNIEFIAYLVSTGGILFVANFFMYVSKINQRAKRWCNTCIYYDVSFGYACRKCLKNISTAPIGYIRKAGKK